MLLTHPLQAKAVVVLVMWLLQTSIRKISVRLWIGWNVTSPLSFMNMPILQYAAEIRSAVLLVHGEKAHSRYFSEGVYEKLTGDNKELLIIPGASHVDLYDNLDVIPFEKLNSFFNIHLK